MPEHKYSKNNLINTFDNVIGKTFEEVDEIGFFNRIKAYDFALQKGVAGDCVEQCILKYAPDSKQEADLLVLDGNTENKVELKTTGMLIVNSPKEHYVAKEPMSITAVGVYDIAEQDFQTSHFWDKIEHMLIVYYLYDSKKAVKPYEYKDFQIKGYEFHEFEELEVQGLKQDWENVRDLVADIIVHHPGVRDKAWKASVKQEYIDRHGVLRQVLNYVDLAPQFPPRFRLKKPVVSNIISKHFGNQLEQLPGRYATLSDIDMKCQELTTRYYGKTIKEIADEFGLPVVSKKGSEDKALAEKIIIAMFGGKSKKLNEIELFARFGLIAKSIAVTSKGKRTEDMKLFRIDFNELVRTEIEDEDGMIRPFMFEDSDFYSYFAHNEFLCIAFQEPENNSGRNSNPLSDNKFLGFRRLVFSDEFIDNTVRPVWDDARNKVMNNQLRDVVCLKKDGKPIINNKSGSMRTAPNFIKSKDNDVFIRGGGKDSAIENKTECVNGIKMLPQYVWIKGSAMVAELDNSIEKI